MHAQDEPEVLECLQVKGRVLYPGAAMFEAARAAGASLCAQKLVPDLALQDAVIPAPLMLQKPQVICPSSPAHLSDDSKWQESMVLHSGLHRWPGSIASIAAFILQASHGHVTARCLVDVEIGILQLDSRSVHAQDTAVHLRAGCGAVSTLPAQV